ncbi:raffinose/stachyose/melibiose transport system permease protein [Curtobacterium sp. UNCCL20]|uniref:carbohydrate ABC transporter permease n=1 Tax=Curtobacterium sp. UNCCL20 TaxID=1502773 RepID=UPI00088CED4A|nr:sugar ABC transporter permease [Curtobacterium sp. UNCCL20]SDQ92439.1 raffinose/stachyose/melibiose transport system permease protein [Curtobacterium sp. UNCCL20]
MTTTVKTPALAPVAPADRHSPRRRRSSVGRALWWFALPALAIYLLIVIVPTVQGAYMSLTNWSAFKPNAEFIGFGNFVTLFQGDSGTAALRTLFIAIATVVIQNVLGLLLALVLSGPLRGRNILRTIIFAPMVVSPLVVGYLFKYIFGPPGTGAINVALQSFGVQQIDFLGNPNTALWIIIVVVVWQFTGSTMIIYLAGLQGVPAELLEAASLDGAGTWGKFRNITLPLLAPAVTINLMIGLIGGLKIFDQIFAITGGGPAGSTETISTLIYKYFSQYGSYGLSAALAVLLAIGVAALSLIQFAVLRRQDRNA